MCYFIDYYIFFAIFNIIDFCLYHETLKRYIKKEILYIYIILSDNGKNKILMYKIKIYSYYI